MKLPNWVRKALRWPPLEYLPETTVALALVVMVYSVVTRDYGAIAPWGVTALWASTARLSRQLERKQQTMITELTQSLDECGKSLRAAASINARMVFQRTALPDGH
jgi:ABC-type uncharacterized transport system permease subunit